MCRQMESSVKNMVIVLAALFFPRIAAYPNGSVTASCVSMEPNHGTIPQQNPAPYILSLSKHNYSAGEEIKVILSTVDGSTPFRGFMIQCRSGSNNTPIGTFKVNGAAAQLLKCTNAEDAVSHTSRDPKDRVEVIWVAPNHQNVSNLTMRATVVQARPLYYMNVTSSTLTYNSGSHLIPALTWILLVTAVLIFNLPRD